MSNACVFLTVNGLLSVSAMDIEFERSEKLLTDLSEEIKRLNEQMQKYLADIIKVATFHRTCTT